LRRETSPQSEYQGCAPPHMADHFPFPVKYGYASRRAGRRAVGPLDRAAMVRTLSSSAIFDIARDAVVRGAEPRFLLQPYRLNSTCRKIWKQRSTNLGRCASAWRRIAVVGSRRVGALTGFSVGAGAGEDGGVDADRHQTGSARIPRACDRTSIR